MREIKQLIIHCTYSDDSLDIGVREIRDWHVSGFGWSDVGYHYVVRRSGKVEAGRPEDKAGAHVRGHNHNSLAVCWVGNKEPSPMQWTALLRLCRELRTKHNIKIGNVFGHFELDPNKTCPNLNMDLVRAELIFKD